MNKRLFIAVIAVAAVILSGCSAAVQPGAPTATATVEATAETAYHKITPEEAKAVMDAGGATVVDVRRADEYAAGHIKGAMLLSNETIAENAEAALPDKDAALIIYCRTGVRSKQASDTLISLGYTNIYDMGGINGWTYETESGAAAVEQ